VTVNRCDEIPSGIYHYDPLKHRLFKLTGYNTRVEAVLRNAQFTAALSFRPQILITLSSRFQRLSWKYRGLAYATTLKNVGVLYQTMYLVATAMGLAPCALGNGNSYLFAEAIGTDYFLESSVGEFVLGTLPKAHTHQVNG
jgi:SagB-type dehydrogenase family enzyme